MKKRLALVISLLLLTVLLAGCAGTPVVYYSDCTCPDGAHSLPAATPAPAEGALKTGLAIIADPSKSKDAAQAEFDVTLAAVLVDENGVIQAAKLDSISAKAAIDANGQITSDLSKDILSKNELGYGYNMKAYAGSAYEWFEQADFICEFAIGKTAEELKTGAVSESGYAKDGTDLATKATIHIAGYVDAIVKAAANAEHVGAQAGDTLYLSAVSSPGSSESAGAEEDGLVQLDVTAGALTAKNDVITGLVIDSVQAKVNFDHVGKITTDLTAPVKTKNELGSAYNMVAWGGAIADWDQQAASFAAYVTGKTPEAVKGISVNESMQATDADLTASVTISIGDFKALIEKAFH